MSTVAPTYYSALGLQPSATEQQVKRAYRRLSLKHHPDCNQDNLPREQCELLLRQMSNALEVLTDKRLRTLYDKHGAAATDRHVFKDPQRVFDEFFGTANPFEALLPTDASASSDILSSYHAMSPRSGTAGTPTMTTGRNSAGKNAGITSPSTTQRPVGSFEKGLTAAATLSLTLEELYTGCEKRIRVKRQRVISMRTEQQTKFLNVRIPPGTLEGTEIRFENEGDEVPGCLPSDIVFRIQAQPHAEFERRRNDLVCRKRISLLQALTQCVVQVTTLDKRVLSVACHSIITPNSRKVVKGEGMPIPAPLASSKTGSQHSRSKALSPRSETKQGSAFGTNLPPVHLAPRARGDLVIEFEIAFPTQLDQNQKALLQQALRR